MRYSDCVSMWYDHKLCVLNQLSPNRALYNVCRSRGHEAKCYAQYITFLICFAHSIAFNQWKNSYFPLRPEPLVGYKLSRVALGTRMLELLLTPTNFRFPSDQVISYIILPSITRTMSWALKKSGKKPCTGVRNFEFWISYWRVVGV